MANIEFEIARKLGIPEIKKITAENQTLNSVAEEKIKARLQNEFGLTENEVNYLFQVFLQKRNSRFKPHDGEGLIARKLKIPIATRITDRYGVLKEDISEKIVQCIQKSFKLTKKENQLFLRAFYKLLRSRQAE